VDVLALVVRGNDDQLVHQADAPWGCGAGTTAAGRRSSHTPAPSSTSETSALAMEVHSPTLNDVETKRNVTAWCPAGTATARGAWSARGSRAGLPSPVTFQPGYHRSASRSTAGRCASTSTSTSCSR